ncbi:hypothetical protein F4859DRAFT_332584 [Xylaria cf. heliscus]|nr:hypothetical protein F4859DRAFT_332584 [Xylaria cf. heliscus]
MKPVTKLQLQINNNSKPGAFDFQAQKRCDSVPLPRQDISRREAVHTWRRDWVSREKPYVPGGTSTRSISLGSRISGRHHDESQVPVGLWPEPIFQASSTPATPRRENYDNDEEDKRNSVPISYPQHKCRPFRASMKQEVEAEFQRLRRRGKELSATLREWEGGYKKARRLFSKTLGLGWTECQWVKFMSFEKSLFDLRDDLFAVQDKMEHRNAQMYLFIERVSSSLAGGVWLRDEDTTTLWSLEVTAEQKAMRGEYPVLEWNGVDYNATEKVYENYENFSSLA